MQHQVSHPLSPTLQGVRRRSRTSALLALSSPSDARYPRSRPWRAVRVLASICWLPFVAGIGYAAAKTALLWGTGAALNPTTITSALGLDGMFAAIQEQPALLAASIPLMGLLVGGVLAVRWSGADRAREVQSLLLREVSPSEQANTNWMRNACFPALRWQIYSLQRRRLVTGLALLLAALVLGMLVALLSSGAPVPLSSLAL